MTVGNETNLAVVPNFIKASTPDLLRELMLINNLKMKSEIKYFDIQFVNGTWIAWYYESIDIYKKIKPKGK
jgi:hypothetical protein